MANDSRIAYIYALVDPFTMEIRYIGWSINPKQRLTSHITESRQKKKHCHHWIQQVLSQGRKPILQIVEEISADNYAEMETYWIKFCRELDMPLTNISDGGERSPGYGYKRSTRKTHQINVRLPSVTLKQIADIQRQFACSQTDVVLMAINKLYTEKAKEG